MKTTLLALLLAASATVAVAQSRPSTTAMSCRDAQALVQARGAIVIGTGGETCDRAVRNTSFCPPFSGSKPLFAPTRDNPSCVIGERCFDYSLDPE